MTEQENLSGGALEPSESIGFGPYRLMPKQRLLLEADKPLRLGSRAMEILIALVERGGQVVSQNELMGLVWPNTHVEETNLRVHIASLRKVLGDGQNGIRYILNSAGRGYTFVAPLVRATPGDVSVSTSQLSEHGDLPARATRLIGRAEFVEITARQIREERLVTIVGPGGVGKTTVALAVAESIKDLYLDGARFVDLSPVAEPHLIPTVLSSALGLSIASEDPLRAAVRFLAAKKMLIVLDTCEHVIEEVGTLVDEIIKAAPGVHILATSREPLRTNSEWVRRLPPLPVPEESSVFKAISDSPAVQLFLERIRASIDTFIVADRDIALAAEICRRLDGLPLAIELAAGRVEQFGLPGLLNRLADSFAPLQDNMRSVDPRHRTLRAMIDWSYTILSPPEKLVLRHIAPFKGWFSPDSAGAVVGNPGIGEREVTEILASLAARSLVTANVTGEAPVYRLLDTNRAYAFGKLMEGDDANSVFRRYCEHFRNLLQGMSTSWTLDGSGERTAVYHRILADVRAALDWALSDDGDLQLFISLTNAAVPLWFQLSLIDECRTRLERAIDVLRPDHKNSEAAMQLYAALGSAHMNTNAVGVDMRALWATVLKIAEDFDNLDYRLRALWGLWVDCCNQGRYAHALELAQRFREAATRSSDPIDLAVSNRWIGVSLHYIGDQVSAREHFERTLSYLPLGTSNSDSVRFQYHQGIAARCYLGQISFLQGFPDQALAIVEQNLEHALSTKHELSICFALAEGACPVALQVNDLDSLDRFVPMLLDLAERRSLTGWHAMGRTFQALSVAKRGHLGQAVSAFGMALNDLRKAHIAARFTSTLGQFAELLAHVGELAEAHAAIDEALQRSEANGEHWCIAELLRIKGSILALETGASAREDGEQKLRLSIDWAQKQGALMWELRAAICLWDLQRQQGLPRSPDDHLSTVYRKFSEGFGRGDLKQAEDRLFAPHRVCPN